MNSTVRHVGGLGCLLGSALLVSCVGTGRREQASIDLDQLVRVLDLDGNRRIEPYEGADALLELLAEADVDRDGGVEPAELRAALGMAREVHGPEEFGTAAADAAEVMVELDGDGDGRLSSEELPEDEREEILDFADSDGDGFVTGAELEDAIGRADEPASFTVIGSRCVMAGVIGPSTPARVLELVCEHPEVEVIEMLDVPGSMDDPANLRAASMVRKHGLATHVPGDGIIASGGVDFFLAGAKRSIDEGGRLGVHSWGGGVENGADLPREHPDHRMYLDFYAEIGIPSGFYWYTLEAASPEDIHWMTPEEIARYDVITPTAPGVSPRRFSVYGW